MACNPLPYWLAQKKIEYVLQKAGSKGQLGIIGFLVRLGGRPAAALLPGSAWCGLLCWSMQSPMMWAVPKVALVDLGTPAAMCQALISG